MKFYDRTNELQILADIEKQSVKSSTFTVLTGRRRVGKTSLITHAMDGKTYAYLFVTKDRETMLCQKFQAALEEQIGLKVYGTLSRFRDVFNVIMEEAKRRHLTVVFDEFQTLYSINPAIFSEIQDVWDRHHNEARINLIVSGSIQSLMRRIFEEKNEPLYGRPTSKFVLRPFTVNVLKQILADACPAYSPEDLLCLYMLTGGVAKYVELLIDAGCTTKEKMLNYVCRQDSYFLSEGRDLLGNEFSGDFGTYFSILQLIASGQTRRSDIDGALQKDMGTYLQNLEKNYEMICRQKPLLAKDNSKVSSYEIRDNFLRFWFRFVYPYQSVIERGMSPMLKKNILEKYEQFTGRTLERYFQDKLMETQQYTQIGNWWDRKGENEIDLVAINEFDHTGIVAEVKRNPRKISMQALEEKIAHLPASDFGRYDLQLKAFSMEDM